MDISLFKQHSLGSLSKHGSGDSAYWFYLPNSLQIQPVIDDKITSKLIKSERFIAQLKGASRFITDPYMFLRPFFVREAQQSSNIEGKHTQIDRLFLIQAEQSLFPDQMIDNIRDDEQEVTNYITAMKYGYDFLQDRMPSISFIKEMQYHLINKTRGSEVYKSPGNFRSTQNWIGRSGCTLNEADFVPPHHDFVDSCMQDLISYILKSLTMNDGFDLLRIALTHYQLETIHPFIDGNGRVGRMLISLLLCKIGLIDHPLLHMSGYFEHNRDKYYALLFNVSTEGNINEWFDFFLDGIIHQTTNTTRKINQIQDWLSKWGDHIEKAKQKAIVMKVIRKLTELPVISVNLASKYTGYTYQGAKNIIDFLVDSNLIKPFNLSKKESYYVCEDILNILIS